MRDDILAEINAARDDAESKHGRNWHNYPTWISLLAEELGEAAKEAHSAHFGGDYINKASARLRAELLDVAQLAVALIEQIDEDAVSGFIVYLEGGPAV